MEKKPRKVSNRNKMLKETNMHLLDEDDGMKSTKNEQEISFKINQDYANSYDTWRTKEEMQKMKDRYGTTDIETLQEELESSESSSDDEPELMDKDFLVALSCLKTKDPRIYDKSYSFFDKCKVDDKAKPNGLKKLKDEAYTLQDHERDMVLNSVVSDEEPQEGNQNLGYNKQLENIKNEFSLASQKYDFSNTADDNTFLKTKEKSNAEKEQEQLSFSNWLATEFKNQKIDPAVKNLDDYWKSDSLNKDEAFLRDFLIKGKFSAECLHAGTDIKLDQTTIQEDEEFESARENFEHKYNFRFEEPDQEFIKRYPRTVADSLRRTDDKRKKNREAKQKAKEEIRQRKLEEVQRLKAIKRKELCDKLRELQETLGGDVALPFKEEDIDGKFDPEKYDIKMNEIFSDRFYSANDSEMEEKPVFPYDPEIDDDLEKGEDFETLETTRSARSEELGAAESMENHGEDGRNGRMQEENGDEDRLIDSGSASRKKPKNSQKKSLYSEKLSTEKPKFDPQIHSSFSKYFDEYYGLHFEGLIGDMPTKFKYRSVVPNDFGLSTKEILEAPDRELNQWASLKKTFTYRPENEERYEVQAYKKKAMNEKTKQRILLSVYSPDNGKDSEVPNDKPEKDGKTNLATSSRNKTKKKRKYNSDKNTDSVEDVSGQNKKIGVERLKSYGINPTKFKKRLKYAK